MKRLKKTLAVISLLGVLLLNGAAFAEVHVVEMLNKGDEGAMVFKPAIVYAQAGDTIHFKATTKGHNVVSFKDMLPEGVTPFKSKFSKDFELVVEKDGTYGYFCQPHLPIGMVGLIVVGDDIDLSTVQLGKKVKGKALKRFNKYLADASKK